MLSQGYKVYYTTDPNQQMASWQYQMVDNSQLTTISDLTPHSIYTIRVQALTSVGPGPLSTPVQIKTQQGVPSQPEMLTAVDIGETKVTLQWNKPTHSAENILSYELYWNDTYAQVGGFIACGAYFLTKKIRKFERSKNLLRESPLFNPLAIAAGATGENVSSRRAAVSNLWYYIPEVVRNKKS